MKGFELNWAANLWMHGYGTAEIAAELNLPESLVWNLLDHIKTLVTYKRSVA